MRELDWKVHEYMGNDLTGWEWDSESTYARFVRGTVFDYQHIPHYSTTWEGAGLIMEWLRARDIFHDIFWNQIEQTYVSTVQLTMRGKFVKDPSAPIALCKAYISAMEERNNG
jgi:hypothetical protein